MPASLVQRRVGCVHASIRYGQRGANAACGRCAQIRRQAFDRLELDAARTSRRGIERIRPIA